MSRRRWYYTLWQFAVALSVGSASALVALLAGPRSPTTGTFQIAFLVEAVVTLAALLAYRSLKPEDGRAVSGHADVDTPAG